MSLIPWYYHPKKRIQNAWPLAMIANVYDVDRSAGASLSLSLSLHTQKTKQLANNDYLNQTKVVAGDDAKLTVRTLGLPPLA